MNKKVLFVMMTLAVLMFATPAFAQAPATAPASSLGNWGLSGIGLGIAVGLAGMGQARVAGSACEGIARNPGAKGGIQLAMILGLAFIESLVLFIWVLMFLRAL
ncbi:MAG TPA: ATP synthase F0 subunit C [Terriglobales bacterium]|nr:ATP synthase F0 subunit C [Terriglobales bacterium]